MKALIKREAFIVDNLRAKMLIGMNILAFKDIDLIISTRSNYIDSCRIKFELVVISPRSFIKQSVMLDKPVSILAKAYIIISIERCELSSDNYMFELADECSIALFASLVNSFFYAILARNNFNELVHLPRKLHIRSIRDLKVDEYYYLSASEETYELIIKLSK